MSIDSIEIQERIIRSYLIGGVVTLCLLVGGVGGWSALASIHGAVIAVGSVIQETNNKRIQHLDGGIIDEVHVEEGQLVKEGAVLISLDGTRVRAELEVVVKRLFEQKVKRLRLIAGRDGQETFQITEELLDEAKQNLVLNSIISVQNRLFTANLSRLSNQNEQHEERIAQLKKEIGGFEIQMRAKEEARELLDKETKGLATLRSRKLVSLQRLNTLLREKNEIESDMGRLKSDIARANGQISETRLKIIETGETFRIDMLRELEKVAGDILELQERVIKANDHLQHLQIRSHQAGRIHELAFFTIGGVVAPGETLMFIVPDSKQFTIEAKIRPSDVDQIVIGRRATIRFTAFNQRTTPILDGKVKFLSPDQIRNEQTDEAYFTVRVSINPSEKDKLGKKEILVGMPAEVMIRTEERTVLSYLINPLSNQFRRAFRED